MRFLIPVYAKDDRFAKTGSTQTLEKLRNKRHALQGLWEYYALTAKQGDQFFAATGAKNAPLEPLICNNDHCTKTRSG